VGCRHVLRIEAIEDATRLKVRVPSKNLAHGVKTIADVAVTVNVNLNHGSISLMRAIRS
jgi:hypothetical protein